MQLPETRRNRANRITLLDDDSISRSRSGFDSIASFGNIDAFDASSESINLAKQLAVENGLANRIFYSAADIDNIKFEANSDDFIVAKMSLHHFEGFDHIFC